MHVYAPLLTAGEWLLGRTCRANHTTYALAKSKAATDPELDVKLSRGVRLLAQGIPLREAARQAQLTNHQALMKARDMLDQDDAWDAMVELERTCSADAALTDAPADAPADVPVVATPPDPEMPLGTIVKNLPMSTDITFRTI